MKGRPSADAGLFGFMTEPERCSVCGGPADLLCDFVIAREKMGEAWKQGSLRSPSQGYYPVITIESRHFTCDRLLCERCTTKGSPTFYDAGRKGWVVVPDYCPDHAHAGDSRSPIVTAEEAEEIRRSL